MQLLYYTTVRYESNQASIESKSNYDDLYEGKRVKKKKRRYFTIETSVYKVIQGIEMRIVIISVKKYT